MIIGKALLVAMIPVSHCSSELAARKRIRKRLVVKPGRRTFWSRVSNNEGFAAVL